MARIEGELVIYRPVDEVFDVVADERNEPRYNPRICRAEQLSPGPIGRGTRFRAEAVMLGRRTGMTMEYTTYERPRRLASSIHMPAADIAGTLRFDPVANGTRMGWSWVVRPRGLYRLLTRSSSAWAGVRSRRTGPVSSGSWRRGRNWRRRPPDVAATAGGQPIRSVR
jgi:hypothetical protein